MLFTGVRVNSAPGVQINAVLFTGLGFIQLHSDHIRSIQFHFSFFSFFHFVLLLGIGIGCLYGLQAARIH